MLISNGLPPSYVLHEMDLWEIPLLVEGLKYQGIYLREGQRLQAWASLAPWSKGDHAPEDIVRYPWDEEPVEEPTLTKEEIKAQQDKIRELINNGTE